MCLYVHPKQPLATNGSYIAVKTQKHYLAWKVCRQYNVNVVTSWYMASKYLFGKLYRLRDSLRAVERRDNAEVHEGFHALRYKTNRWQGMRLGGPNNLYPCIIPAGSKVIYGRDGDVVSNRLIVFRDIEQLNEWCANNPVT